MKFSSLIFFLTIVFGLSACSFNGEPRHSSKSNNPAPEFSLVDTDGNTHQLSTYKGKKVYIKFWASWCPICLSGMEELSVLTREKNDFVVLTMVSPRANGEKNIDSFNKWWSSRKDLSNIKVLLDENGLITSQYNVLGYPTSVFISSNGELVKVAPGHYSNDQIKAELINID